jgi:hypothetical protein
VRFRSSAFCAVVLAAFPLATAPASATKVCAYAIPVEMITKVDSRTARAGGVFRFRTLQDAEIDDGLAIPKGTIGWGVIRYADKAARHNHDGSLALEPRYLVVPENGEGVKVVEVTMNPTLPAIWSPSEPLLQRAASHVPLPVPGLAMTAVNTVRWGRNIVLGPGFTFTVLPAENLSRGPVC